MVWINILLLISNALVFRETTYEKNISILVLAGMMFAFSGCARPVDNGHVNISEIESG